LRAGSVQGLLRAPRFAVHIIRGQSGPWDFPPGSSPARIPGRTPSQSPDTVSYSRSAGLLAASAATLT
jgi:hypothetical protein